VANKQVSKDGNGQWNNKTQQSDVNIQKQKDEATSKMSNVVSNGIEYLLEQKINLKNIDSN